MYIFLILVVFLAAFPANAYIDPGTGSMFLQGLLAFFAAIGAGVVSFRYKIKEFFNRKKNK